MRVPRLLAILTLLAMAFSLPASQAGPVTDTTGWYPFTLPWDDSSPTVVDASDLLRDHPDQDLTAVIATRGFVSVSPEGHFVFSNTGQRARFWGTNLTFSAAFPPSPDYPPAEGELQDTQAAGKMAARLAKLGFNAVRLHHMDNQARPAGLWLDPWNDTQHIDPVQLGRLDWLIYQLKQHGIYVDLNLHVSRQMALGDGVTDADVYYDSGPAYNKLATLYDPVMIALQKRYARELLEHTNPYTGLAYKDDPVILTTEITNENSLFLGLAENTINYDPAVPRSLPAFYSQELDGWSSLAGGPQINRLRNPGFEGGTEGWAGFTFEGASATFSAASGGHTGSSALQVEVQATGREDWHVQFGQGYLALQDGKQYVLSFAARASRPTEVWGAVMRNAEPYDSLGWSAAVPLTTAWTVHTIPFTAVGDTFGPARVSFDVGQTAPIILWFDSFALHEVDAYPGWHGWLAERYGSTAALRAAWAPADPVAETELLTNRSFESGLPPWVTASFAGAQANWSLDSSTRTDGAQSLRSVITTPGAEWWHVQVVQGGLGIEAGQTYRVRFDAKASAPGPVGVSVMQNHNPWNSLGLYEDIELATGWQSFTAVFTASMDEADARLAFDLGQTARTVWIDNVSLTPYNPPGLLDEESLEANNIARLARHQWGGFSPARVRDTVRFYRDAEDAYFQEMRAFIQAETGSRSLTAGTADYYQHLPQTGVMAGLDFVDGHTYWDHPYWPEVEPWSPAGWYINNTPLVNDLPDSFLHRALGPVQGKPYTLTEFNAVTPNRYEVEGPLVMASFAAFQDWDAVFQFDYAGNQLELDAGMAGFFSLSGNPVDTVLMPLASRLFITGQIAPAPVVSGLQFTEAEALDSLKTGWGGSSGDYVREVKGVPPAAALGSRIRIADLDAAAPVAFSLPAPTGPVYTAAGGQLVLDKNDPERSIYRLAAPGLQGAVGFIAGRPQALPDVTVEAASEPAEFAAVLVQSLDGQPIPQSADLLVVALSRFENTGMVWNAEGTSVNDQWGSPPTLLEPVRATLTLEVADASQVEVWALDNIGARQARLPFETLSPTQIRFSLDTGVQGTPWYNVHTEEPNAVRLVEVESQQPTAGPVWWPWLAGGGLLVVATALLLVARRARSG